VSAKVFPFRSSKKGDNIKKSKILIKIRVCESWVIQLLDYVLCIKIEWWWGSWNWL